MINRVVEAFSKAVARVHSVLRAKTDRLIDLRSPREIPDRFARQLAWDAGFSDDVPLAQHLATPDEWRRAADLAFDTWDERGVQPSIRNIVRAWTGARCWIGDWFGLRTLAGLSGFPWYGTSALGPYTTHVHIEDPTGTMDRDRAMAAVETVLGIGESFVVTFVHMVEGWDNLFRWTTSGPATLGDQRLLLQGVSSARLDTSIIDVSGWAQVAHTWIAHISAGNTAWLQFRDTGATYYRVEVTEGGGGGVVLKRESGGTVVLGTAAVGVRGRPAAAAGTITVVAGALLVDGDSFTLDDGLGGVVTYEYDDDGVVAAGSVAVPFTAADTPSQVRNATIDAINNTPRLRITATINAAAVLDLLNDKQTILGNKPVTEAVGAAGFLATGMAGGVDPDGVRVDVQTFPTVGPGLDIKVLIDGIPVLLANDAAPLPIGGSVFATTGFVDVLYYEVLPLTGQDIRTIP